MITKNNRELIFIYFIIGIIMLGVCTLGILSNPIKVYLESHPGEPMVWVYKTEFKQLEDRVKALEIKHQKKGWFR